MRVSERENKEKTVSWVSVVGARPQFIKLAPVCRAIEAHNREAGHEHIVHTIVHTGQHYDREVAELLFTQLKLPEPNYNLAAGSGSHAVQLARMMERLEPILEAHRPDWVIVYGDTNSTLAGALVAARSNFPLAHVEAGCRSFDIAAPEEQTRVMTDHLSQLLFAPSRTTVENLCREGIGAPNDPRKRRVILAGDVTRDALREHVSVLASQDQDHLDKLGLQSRKFYLLTIHRAENTNNAERLASILSAAEMLDLPVLFPVHPRTRHALTTAGITLNGNLRPVAPLGYLEMLAVEKHARKILTDSGGVQKEAFYLGIPCITLLNQTEWPETVQLGANCTVGATRDAIVGAVAANVPDPWWATDSYGDEKVAPKIVSELLGG
jgi:UDP-N-acetylglucosamine 2-epimerase